MAFDIQQSSSPIETMVDIKRDYSEKRSAPIPEYKWHNDIPGSFKYGYPTSATTVASSRSDNSGQPVTRADLNTISSSKVEYTLTDTWGKQMMKFLSADDTRWAEYSIDKSEKYLLALINNTESRNFISGYLMIMRTGNQRLSENQSLKNQLQRFLKDYLKSNRSASDRMAFIRASRSIGLSPSSAV